MQKDQIRYTVDEIENITTEKKNVNRKVLSVKKSRRKMAKKSRKKNRGKSK